MGRARDLLQSQIDVNDGNSVFPAQSHPELLTIARESRLMRFATDQNAARQPYGIGAGAGQRVKRVAHDLLVNGVDEFELKGLLAVLPVLVREKLLLAVVVLVEKDELRKYFPCCPCPKIIF